MGLKVCCRACSEQYDVKETLAGKEFTCKSCGASVKVPPLRPVEVLDELEEVLPIEEVEEVLPIDELEEVVEVPAARKRENTPQPLRQPSSLAREPRTPRRESHPEPEPQSSHRAELIVVSVLIGGAILGFIIVLGMMISFFMPQQGASGSHGVTATGNPNGAGLPGMPNAGPVPIPQPPLALVRPAAPDSQIDGDNLNEMDVDDLRGMAADFAAEGDYQKAMMCQYAAAIKDHGGQYNLACYYSRIGNADAALYWMQVAAQEEGVDSEWVLKDPDLDVVRADQRWPVMLQYLRQYNSYWQVSGVSETSLVLPRNASKDRPLPVLIGLHGMGDNAHHFVDPENYQQFADQHQMAVLGVSGTFPKGKRSFVWSENPMQDLARIDAALKEVSDRLTVQPGQVILFGFSQGAMAAAEIAARHPDRFAGAIVMSPGGNGQPQITTVAPQPNQSTRQGYVLVCGAGEHPGNVLLTSRYSTDLRRLGARVSMKLYPQQNYHTFPADFFQKLPLWCQFIRTPGAAMAF